MGYSASVRWEFAFLYRVIVEDLPYKATRKKRGSKLVCQSAIIARWSGLQDYSVITMQHDYNLRSNLEYYPSVPFILYRRVK